MDTTSTATTQEAPQPVQTAERVVLLDVIRGFALGGVFFSNVYMWFNGRFLMPPSYWKDYKSEGVDSAILWIFRNLVFGRFITIFSFLFGLGIAVQFLRANKREDSASVRYTRRALAMMLFGAIHIALIWYGDILHVYALFGFAILLFRRASTKTLIVTGALLTFLAPAITGWCENLLPHLWTSAEVLKQQQEATMAKMTQLNADNLSLLQSHSYLDIIRGNLLVYWHYFARPHVLGFYLGLVGNFLLGFAAGRVELFANIDKYRRLFWHLLGWGALASVSGGLGMMILRATGPGKKYFVTNETIVPTLMPLVREIQTLGTAAFYLAAISFLFQRAFGRRLLSIYAPVGRMAVTNYLLESVVALFIFTGIGLGKIGDMSPVWSALMPAMVFPVQMVASWLWLKHFSFGPVEWLWRSMTYGKWFPLRKPTEVAKFAAKQGAGEPAVVGSGTV
ncbi:MAG TPA: DUF418 domain-containing protein [Polyangium sp.]|nr:DUF418 domain-containing protein [Polyangium sp.]